MVAIEVIAGTLLILVGVMGLALAWRRPRGAKALPRLAGWLCIAGGFVAYGRAWSAEVGITYACLALAMAAYGVIAAGMEVRTAPNRMPREAALEPEERATNWGRGIAKSLLAVVLSGIASIGVGVAIAVAMPMAVVDRIMLGGILVPVLWGAGMAWTLSDAKLVRATLVLLSVSLISYGIAFLPKVLA